VANELIRDRNLRSLAAANRDVYGSLKNVVKVEIRTSEVELMAERMQLMVSTLKPKALVLDWHKPQAGAGGGPPLH